MDAITPRPRLLPTLAEELKAWFPELGGRALAVSECSVTKENIPTLPLVMLAFVRSLANPPIAPQQENLTVDHFVIEFWLEPARYKKANNSETPFWSYYDYEGVRDTLLSHLMYWEAPGGERIAYRGLTIEAEAFAVTLTFAFTATFHWCPKLTPRGEPFRIAGFNLCTPKGCCPDSLCEELEEVDPCP